VSHPYLSSEEEAHYEAARAEALSQYKIELGNRDTRLGDAFRTIGPGSEEWRGREARLVAANDDVRSKFLALNRATDRKRISPLATRTLLFGLCILETPVNKFMFDILLVLQNWESYVVSFAMSLAMLYLAEIAGFQTRQIKGDSEDRIYWGKIASAIFILAFLILAVSVLTVCRAYSSSMAMSGENLDIFSHVLEQVKHLGPWAVLMAALEDRGAVMLAAFNFTGIICAFFLAFITHDSDTVYQGSLDEAEDAHKKFARLAKKYEKAIARIGKKHTPRLLGLAAAFGSHNARVVGCKKLRNAPLDQMDLLDISSLDTKLAEARRGIGDRVRRIAPVEGAEAAPKEVAPMPPKIVRERRA
jgi:hypothetical protein